MMRVSYKHKLGLLILSLLLSSQSYAKCTVDIGKDSTADGDSAILNFGRINLGSSYLQPVGTVLSTITVSPTTSKYSQAETILMTCDYADKDEIYELFATNGDDRVGGYWEIGNGEGASVNDGMPGYYATWFPYLGLKTTHLNSGKVVSRIWQKAPLKNYEVSADGTKIYVKTKHLSNYSVELARVSTEYAPLGSRSNYCATNPIFDLLSIVLPYTCIQPNFYVQLGGPDLYIGYADVEGEDSATNFDFWLDNGVAFGLRTGLTMSYFPTCVVRNHTPVVLFPTASTQLLEAGNKVEASLNISLECENDVKSGVGTNQTALGFMASAEVESQASLLGLISGEGITYLLSDNYATDSSLAQNVGIRLWDSQGTNIPFVRSTGYLAGTASGRSAGWVPVLENVETMGSVQTGHTSYIKQLTASLEKLPTSGSVTAGKVNAHARIIIKVQ